MYIKSSYWYIKSENNGIISLKKKKKICSNDNTSTYLYS